jgi:hypothetical protein
MCICIMNLFAEVGGLGLFKESIRFRFDKCVFVLRICLPQYEV